MSELLKLSLKKLVMRSPNQDGIKKRKDIQTFPASPTLLKSLDLPENLIKNFIKTRNKLLQEKLNLENIVYDSRLRPYQNADVNFLTKLTKGKAIFNQQRTGKTPTTLVTMKTLNQQKNIIFVPKSAIYKWVQEYKKWHGGKVYTLAPSWTKKKRIQAYKTFKGTLITNYDKAYLDFEELIKYFSNADAIVLDEAHILRTYTNNIRKSSEKSTFQVIDKFSLKRITIKKTEKEAEDYIEDNDLKEIAYIDEARKYNSAKTSVFLIKLRKIFKDAYALTGTPTANHKKEFYGILAFLFPDLFTNYYPTMEYYFKIHMKRIPRQVFQIKEIKNFLSKNKEQELLEFIETFSIMRKRKDIMKWLPEADKEVIKLEPTKLQKKLLEELKEYFECDNIICQNALDVMIAMRQVSLTPLRYNYKELGPKFEWVLDTIKDYPEKPIIIASTFTGTLKLLKNIIKNKTEILEGSTSPKERFRIEQDFQNGKFNILLANIKVTHVQMTLSRAEQLILLDESLIAVENEQMEDRILPTTIEEKEKKEGQLITRLFLNTHIDNYLENNIKNKLEESKIINNYIDYLIKNKK